MIGEYEHTQPGTLIRVMMGVMLLVFLAIAGMAAMRGDSRIVMLFPVGVLMICLLLFHSLSVRVTGKDVSLAFGIGLIKKHFLVSDIAEVSTSRSHWYNGWGIRKIWGGWLYNVSGYDVVQLTMKNGKICQIGTDEPHALQAAIESAVVDAMPS